MNGDRFLRWLIITGLILRLAFMKWGAPLYYGTPDYATNGGDTWAWVSSMQNLVHTGTYTADPNYPDGKFFRPPGYALFLMVFYILSGFNLALSFKLAAFVQILLDTISIWLVYQIIRKTSRNETLSAIGSFLYCFYPFALVWTSVLYPESPSLFFMLLSIYLIVKPVSARNYIISGLSLGFSVLLRVQIIFLLPAIAWYLYKRHQSLRYLILKPAICFFLAFGACYGSWPLRNLFYGKFIPAQELVNDKHFSEDFVSYMFYIWSVKTDHRPQFDQIINGQQVQWPEASYLNPGDSATLAHLARLCDSCGRGFSHFQASTGLIKSPIIEDNECTRYIASEFKRLRSEQIRNNTFHFLIEVPLGNFKKAFFKSGLYDKKSWLVQIISSLLFSVRTLLIFTGLAGIWYNRKACLIDRDFCNLLLIYFIGWYVALCAGYRNIEMRYFLPTDVLLLIPAGLLIHIPLRIRSEKVKQRITRS